MRAAPPALPTGLAPVQDPMHRASRMPLQPPPPPLPPAGLTVAEYFRDVEGQDVLLFVDNIFRFTQVGSVLRCRQRRCWRRCSPLAHPLAASSSSTGSSGSWACEPALASRHLPAR
jgi:hypothetical protein